MDNSNRYFLYLMHSCQEEGTEICLTLLSFLATMKQGETNMEVPHISSFKSAHINHMFWFFYGYSFMDTGYAQCCMSTSFILGDNSMLTF